MLTTAWLMVHQKIYVPVRYMYQRRDFRATFAVKESKKSAVFVVANNNQLHPAHRTEHLSEMVKKEYKIETNLRKIAPMLIRFYILHG